MCLASDSLRWRTIGLLGVDLYASMQYFQAMTHPLWLKAISGSSCLKKKAPRSSAPPRRPGSRCRAAGAADHEFLILRQLLVMLRKVDVALGPPPQPVPTPPSPPARSRRRRASASDVPAWTEAHLAVTGSLAWTMTCESWPATRRPDDAHFHPSCSIKGTHRLREVDEAALMRAALGDERAVEAGHELVGLVAPDGDERRVVVRLAFKNRQLH